MTGKKKNQLKPEEAAELRKRVQVGALLVIRLSMPQKDASRLTGVPESSFNRYLQRGLPDGELWPEGTNSDPSLETQYNQYAEMWKKERESTAHGESSDGRDSQGRFTVGNTAQANRLVIQARADLEKLLPKAVKKFSRALDMLSPQQDPGLTIQCCNTLFDRILGKPKQSLDIQSNSQSWEQYGWIGDIIQAGDERSIRLAAQLAASMEGYARHDGLPFEPRQVEIVPPLDGAVNHIDPGSSRQVASPHHQHASTEREE